MEFGVFAQGAVPQPLLDVVPLAEHHRLMDNVELGICAEQCGFKYVWASEHHPTVSRSGRSFRLSRPPSRNGVEMERNPS